MALTNDSKAVIALTTRLGGKDRPSLTAQKWDLLHTVLTDAGHSPAALFDRRLDIRNLSGIDTDLADRIERLIEDAAGATLEADELQHRGIWTLTIVDPDYPDALRSRLGRNSPPVLFGAGNQSLLHQQGVGIVGSRDVGEDAADVARQIAEAAVDLGLPVISGGARGVDQLAMRSGFESDGSVIGVLADSLQTAIRQPATLEILDTNRACLVVEQAPWAGFSPASAMSRNKIVYGLAVVTVIVASARDSGGTWAGAVEAIKHNNGTVAVWRGPGEGPGNAELERRGAVPLTDVRDIARLLDQPSHPTGQMSLLETD